MRSFRPVPPVVVGLTGGIASGKSAVARLFADAGLTWIDADAEARQVVERDDVRAALRARFGVAAFRSDDSLDRQRLAAIVFGDARARADLEAITHPAIRASISDRLEGALRSGRSVVLDVPLLIEGGLIDRCDVVVFVDAPAPLRRARARERGWTADELARREASQAPLAVKKARAAATISTAGSIDRTRDQVARLLALWARQRPGSERTS